MRGVSANHIFSSAQPGFVVSSDASPRVAPDFFEPPIASIEEETVNSVLRSVLRPAVVRFSRASLIVMVSLIASACVYIDGERVDTDDWRDTQRDNRELISQLELGVQSSAVAEMLGIPADSEAFDRDGEQVRVLFYRTQHKHSDGDTIRDETTPLVFKNDRLVGWGNTTYMQLLHGS
jgi:hypothetical protein